MSNQEQTDFTNLIQEHNSIIHKVISLYIDNQEDKKDLHQEVLLQAWKSYNNFQGRSAFSTWLYKVALNTVLTFNKKRKNRRSLDNVENIESNQDHLDDSEFLYQIIKSFGEIDKMLISLHLDGYKNIEIAEITGMTQNHINVKIQGMIIFTPAILMGILGGRVLDGWSLSECFQDSKTLIISLILILVFTPLLHWGANKMNEIAFGAYLRKLEESIMKMEALT